MKRNRVPDHCMPVDGRHLKFPL